MIIIEEQQELALFLEKLKMESVGLVKLDSATLEVSRLLGDDLAIVHVDILNSASAKLMAKLEVFHHLMVFDPNSILKVELPNVVEVVTAQTNKNALKNLITDLEELLREKQVLRSQMIGLNQELSEIMGNVETELLRIKKMYELKTPRRFQDIKGIQVYSKYAAGENIGGEFFDIYMEQNKLFVLMSATSSYLASSSILQIFAKFKNKKEITHEAQTQLLEDIKNEVITLNSNKKKQITLELFTAILDLNKHTVEGHVFGQFKIMSSMANNYNLKGKDILTTEVSEGQFARNIERGERIFLSSPGFVKNWEKLNPQFMIEELVLNKKIKPLDILDEVFFQLKKETSSGFLSFDASAIILEVQKNAMVEV